MWLKGYPTDCFIIVNCCQGLHITNCGIGNFARQGQILRQIIEEMTKDGVEQLDWKRCCNNRLLGIVTPVINRQNLLIASIFFRFG